MEAERNVSLSFVPADWQGNLDYGDFARLIRPETRAIVCTHASNLTGNAVDIGRVGEIAHAHGLTFIVDASQTAGVLPINMSAQHIDILCFTGHKSLMGPQGTGGLCLGERVKLRPWKVGGTGVQTYSRSQPEQLPTRLEAGTATRAAATPSRRRHRRRSLPRSPNRRRSRHRSRRPTQPRTAVAALNIRDYDSGEVADALSQDYGIATRSGAHCAPRMHRALGTEHQGAVRFSFGWFNTEAEIDTAIQAVKELAE